MTPRIRVAMTQLRSAITRLDMHITVTPRYQVPMRPVRAIVDTRELDLAVEGLHRALRDQQRAADDLATRVDKQTFNAPGRDDERLSSTVEADLLIEISAHLKGEPK